MAGEIAIHTAKTLLKYGASAGTMNGQITVKDIPDLGGAPSTIEVTDLEAWPYKQYIDGLQDLEQLEFLCNYTKENYKKVLDLSKEGLKYFEIWIGETGEHGKFAFKGNIKPWKAAIPVDAAHEFKFTITPQDGIEFKEGA